MIKCFKCYFLSNPSLYFIVPFYYPRKRGRPQKCVTCHKSIMPYVVYSFQDYNKALLFPYC